MQTWDWIRKELGQLREAGLFRDPKDCQLRELVRRQAVLEGVDFVDASSNDYLGYAALPGSTLGVGELDPDVDSEELGGVRQVVSRETKPLGAPFASSSGGGASRLLGGGRPEHDALERLLANWTGHEDSLLFSSGYAANLGLLASLPQKGDTIYSDDLNHASIVDGCRLSKGQTVIYPHLDLAFLETELKKLRPNTTGRNFIVSESYFSMDADSPDLQRLRGIATEFDAILIVDEAHALGVFGRHGAGLCEDQGVAPDITVGTLGKTVGLQGAFVAGPSIVKAWLWNRARSFIYSTATTPILAAATLCHVKHVQHNDSARARLHHRSLTFRRAIHALGLTTPPNSHGPIVPVILGDNYRTKNAAQALRDRGILAYPIRPPTVPPGTARIRFTINSATSESAFAHLLSSLEPALRRS